MNSPQAGSWPFAICAHIKYPFIVRKPSWPKRKIKKIIWLSCRSWRARFAPFNNMSWLEINQLLFQLRFFKSGFSKLISSSFMQNIKICAVLRPVYQDFKYCQMFTELVHSKKPSYSIKYPLSNREKKTWRNTLRLAEACEIPLRYKL